MQLVQITQFVTYSLCATFRISLCTTYPQHIYCGSISTEEAAVIISISVNAPNESFGGPQRELHTIFATWLAHWKCARYWMIRFGMNSWNHLKCNPLMWVHTCNFTAYRNAVTLPVTNTIQRIFPPPHVPYGLRGLRSWLWPKCNRFLRLGRPWGAVTLSRWGGWWYINMKYQEGP
jgi:hypothetical protein